MASPNPFLGVHTFTTSDSTRFYGRDELVRDIRDSILVHHGVTLYGPAFVGKSSLLRAALIPALFKEPSHHVAIAPEWLSASAPSRNLAAAISSGLGRDSLDLTQSLLAVTSPTRPPTVLILDQAEQLLKQDPRELAILLQQLETTLVHRGDKLRVVFVIREGVATRWDSALQNYPLLSRSRLRIPPLSLDTAATSLVKTATRGTPPQTWDIGTLKVLAQHLSTSPLGDSPAPDLALLQLVCHQMWDTAGGQIWDRTRAASFIGEYVGETLASLGSREPDAWLLLERLFVTRGGDRVPVTRASGLEVIHEEQTLDHILKTLEKAHILQSYEHQTDTFYELVHPWMVTPILASADARRLASDNTAAERQRRRRRDLMITSLVVMLLITTFVLLLLIETRSALNSANRERADADLARKGAFDLKQVAEDRARQLERQYAELEIQGQALERNQNELQFRTQRALDAETRARSQARRARDALKMAAAAELLSVDPSRAVLFLRDVEDPFRAPRWEQYVRQAQAEILARMIVQHPEKRAVCGAASPDGSRALLAFEDGSAEVWPADGRGEPVKLPGNSGFVNACLFSPDGRSFLLASDLPDATCLYPADGSQPPICFTLHYDKVSAAEFSPDATQILTGSRDRTARLWSAVDGRPLCLLEGHEDTVGVVTSDGSGTVLATGGDDGRVILWRWTGSSCERLYTLPLHTSPVTALALSQDGQWLAAGGRDGVLKVTSLTNGQVLRTRRHRGTIIAAEFTRDGTYCRSSSADGEISVWSVRSEGTLGESTLNVGPLHRFTGKSSPWGRWLAALSGGDIAAHLDLSEGKLRTMRGHRRTVLTLSLSTQGSLVVSTSQDGSARMWSMTPAPYSPSGDIGALQSAMEDLGGSCIPISDRVYYLLEEEAEAQQQWLRCEERQGRRISRTP